MEDRRELVEQLGLQVRRFEVKSDGKSISISANGEEDTQNLTTFLRDNPKMLEELGGGLPRTELAERMHAVINATVAAHARVAGSPTPSPIPSNPTRMSDALARFAASKKASAENSARTSRDKKRLLEKLVAHLVAAGFDADPFVHDVATNHLSAFLDSSPVKTNWGGVKASDEASPKTLIKKISDLASFFQYAKNELRACDVDPTIGLDTRRKALHKAANKQERHYKAFTGPQLTHVFEPRAYLEFNRDPDYFWTPLLGLHLGTRLAEIVTLELTSIIQRPSGIWTIGVTEDVAKNANSSRVIPIPDALIHLGFIDYVKRVKALGGTHLFPHRDVTTSTFLSDPSKNTSRNWGEYLTARNVGHEQLGLDDPDLVFHSFRHTVVTALQDGGTPLADSMQLVGHQAQDHALKTGHITAEQARSVHSSVYSHADVERMGVEDPLARLKQHLDRCIRPPIDYPRLMIAAGIVSEHLVPSVEGFRSGWSKLKKPYTETQLARLG